MTSVATKEYDDTLLTEQEFKKYRAEGEKRSFLIVSILVPISGFLFLTTVAMIVEMYKTMKKTKASSSVSK